MLGNEQNPPGPPRTSLPPTVVASHFRACADDLAVSLTAAGTAATVPELIKVVRHLVAGQQALAIALEGMAGRVEIGSEGALSTAPMVDVEVVAEVLRAAATAVDCSADALAESRPSFECVSESVAPDTRL
ncbi:hypothetical protein AB0N89_09415 [Amycolatopsis sp. NPDC089917]|uniref:hypothetical protein n=1 Tax=Amycolatopsis sp. NPDC089917 TaxID=3155187 RepID=UPI00341F4434